MKMTAKVEGGKLRFDNPAALPICLREYDGKRVTVDIEPERIRRSGKANARHWAVVVPLVRHCLNLKRGDDPSNWLTKDQTHYVIVTAFGASEETELGSVPVRSSLMDKGQFHEMDLKAEAWLADQGYGIPDGSDDFVAQQVMEATE